MTELYPYQRDGIEEFERAVAKGHRRILIVSPTGSGKTVVGSAIVGHYRAQHKTSLVLAHRREIIGQTVKKLANNGIRSGIIMAGEPPRQLELVQVASIATLWARAFRSDTMQMPHADLLMIDECHHAPATTYRKIIAAYPDAILVGLTATPCHGNGKGLGGIFDVMIELPQVAELTELGYLVPAHVYAPVIEGPDLRGVATKAGDYVESQLADRIDRDQLVGDVVSHWIKYGERRRTVCFAVNVAHSLHIRDEFVRAGVRAEHIDGGTSKDERDATLARLETGAIEIVVNCQVLTEGFDLPDLGCCILARPTKRMGLYKQMIGRVLRPAPGKAYAIILDHAGACFRHGMPADHVDWTLDPEKVATAPAHMARQQRPGGGLVECSQCSGLRLGGQACPCCGFMPARRSEYVPVRAGDLGLVKGGKASAPVYDRDEWHAMLTWIAEENGYSHGWIGHKFKSKFGTWPPWRSGTPRRPSEEVRAWVRHEQIRFAKSQRRAGQ
jgi:superfamily II DNA or RNA helicase